MAFYKEKIQKQLKKALENFRSNQNRCVKTRFIQKQFQKKRVFRPRMTFHSQITQNLEQNDHHVFNFCNLITINQKSILNRGHDQSYLQSHFHYKTIRKIEVKDNYIVLFLNDSGSLLSSIQSTIQRYKRSLNNHLREVGIMLQKLYKKMDLATSSQQTDISLTAETYDMLDGLGSTPFICKIFSEKLVISKSLLQLKEYDSEELLIESVKYKFPLFEIITCTNYYQIIQKQIEFYSILMDVLQGSIPFASFLGIAEMTFQDTIISKNNTEYKCQMSLSMPIPLVQLIKVDEVIAVREKDFQDFPIFLHDSFSNYQRKIRERENTTLNSLIKLPVNYRPENKSRVPNYIKCNTLGSTQDMVKLQLQEKKSSGVYSDKHSPSQTSIREEPLVHQMNL